MTVPAKRGPKTAGRSWLTPSVVSLAVALLATLPYLRLLRAGFIGLDDQAYVVENEMVRGGLSWPGIRWAFTTFYQANWHPLTWISHQADVSLFGLRPWGHHLVGILLHAASSVLLYLLLRRATGAPGASALVAALFAVHPVHVESVAWVAERKDVLAGLLFMLGLGCYRWYLSRPGGGRYALLAAVFALGLLAKPMVVTFPFVLLLLDWWPLGRLQWPRRGVAAPAMRGVLAEKIPLLAMSLASSVVTYLAQAGFGAVERSAFFTLPRRLGGALLAYARYVEKTVWPSHLAVFYPHPRILPGWWVAAGFLLAAGGTLAVVGWARRLPFLAVGWLWFLGMLVPVIGIIQVGGQAMADRYLYLPVIGLFLMAAWGGRELAARRGRRLEPWLLAGGFLWVAALAPVTVEQTGHWRDSLSLYIHTLTVAPNNYLIRTNLGAEYVQERRYDEALAQFRLALEDNPNFPVTYNNLGFLMVKLHRYEEAGNYFAQAVSLWPTYASAHKNHGLILEMYGRIEEALAEYEAAARLDPQDRDSAQLVEDLRRQLGRAPAGERR